ncbi:aminoglycoside phosphotransferase family protein [Nigerium massiliense]|uniref:aminoglycoside phosphotransferase family protein n=1 Tax=Nigerium massiliense TaxID=1522317 RepID=UPI000693D175|nr:aminoglycoside phosphotransferase family protein [Nigerium massiliense]
MTHLSAGTRGWLRAQGERGEAWAAGLDQLAADCADRWRLDLGYPIEEARSSLVLRAVRDGKPFVLKIAPPGPAVELEERILSAANGRGYVRLLESDVPAGVLLLEGLGASLASRLRSRTSGEHDGAVVTYLPALQQAWQVPATLVPAPDRHSHPAGRLAQRIATLARTPSAAEYESVIARALRYAEQRWEADVARAQVLVHGDPQPRHVCAAPPGRVPDTGGEVLVDPAGLRCEREYDLGSALMGANRAILTAEDAVLLVRGWCATLAEQSGTDAEAIWQWAFIRRVAAGLELQASGTAADEARLSLQAASWLITRR